MARYDIDNELYKRKSLAMVDKIWFLILILGLLILICLEFCGATLPDLPTQKDIERPKAFRMQSPTYRQMEHLHHLMPLMPKGEYHDNP